MSIICILALGHRSKEWSYQHTVKIFNGFDELPEKALAVYYARCDRCGEPISKRVRV